jgi:hypothetical protein
MWPFTATDEKETAPQAGNANELRLVEVQKECEQIEEAFNESFRALAEHDAFRVRLASEQARIAARRAALLEERATLRKVLGIR